ncbi:MAG: PaaI family thioesterase, partial [Candidatus Binatia bacterium]
MNVLDLPFIQHLGLQISADGELSLPIANHHRNHLGTVHATVLYGIAEACSGQAIIDKFFKPYPNALVVIRRAAIKYRSPARADLSARLKKSAPDLDSVLERLQERGLAKCEIEVETRS